MDSIKNSWVITVFDPEPFPSSDVGRPAIHCITWGYTTIHCTILYYPTLPFTSFDYITTVKCIASHYRTLDRISCIASHDITSPYLKQKGFPIQKTTFLLCFFSREMGKKHKSISPWKTVRKVPLESGWHRCRSPQSDWPQVPPENINLATLKWS